MFTSGQTASKNDVEDVTARRKAVGTKLRGCSPDEAPANYEVLNIEP